MTMTEAITAFLQERPGEKFTAQQLAEWYRQTHPDACQRRVLIGELSEMIEKRYPYPGAPDRKLIRETATLLADRLLAQERVPHPLETDKKEENMTAHLPEIQNGLKAFLSGYGRRNTSALQRLAAYPKWRAQAQVEATDLLRSLLEEELAAIAKGDLDISALALEVAKTLESD